MTSLHVSAREHLTATDLEDLFLAEEPWPSERSVSHLVDGCPTCGELVTGLWSRWRPSATAPPGELSVHELEAQGFQEKTCARVMPRVRGAHLDLASEREDAKRLLAQLLAHPPQRQLMVVGNSRRHHTWGLCELLLDEAWCYRHRDPRRTGALARLAVAVSGELPEDRYGPGLTRDLQARCWIGWANARRILGDYREAGAALQEAHRLLGSGTGSSLDLAYWHDMRASLRISLGEFGAAERDVGFAARIYYESAQRHALGSALIKRGMIADEIGEAERAIVLGRAGLELIDPELDPGVRLGGWLNVIRSLHSSGRHRDALAALARIRPVYAVSSDRTTVLRFQWLEGDIAAALGRDDQAEGCLRETKDGFMQLEIPHDAAIVSLDLAILLSRQGRNAEVIALATEMIAVFESQGMRVDTLSALILLRRAAERERLDEVLLQRLRARVRGVRS